MKSKKNIMMMIDYYHMIISLLNAFMMNSYSYQILNSISCHHLTNIDNIGDLKLKKVSWCF